jgi:hypothetical protein
MVEWRQEFRAVETSMFATKSGPRRLALAAAFGAGLAALTAGAALACESYGNCHGYRHDGYGTGNYSCYGGGYDCRYEGDGGSYYHDDYRGRYRSDGYRYEGHRFDQRYRHDDRGYRERHDYDRW